VREVPHRVIRELGSLGLFLVREVRVYLGFGFFERVLVPLL
jgi:hypothetical protein